VDYFPNHKGSEVILAIPLPLQISSFLYNLLNFFLSPSINLHFPNPTPLIPFPILNFDPSHFSFPMPYQVLFESPVHVVQLLGFSQRNVGSSPRVRLLQKSTFQYIFEVIDLREPDPLLRADIISVLNLHFQTSDSSVHFSIDYSNQTFFLVLVFDSSDSLTRFIHSFVNLTFQQTNQRRIQASDSTEIDQYIEYLARDRPPAPEPDDSDFFALDAQPSPEGASDGGQNSILRVSPATQTSFVMRRYPTRCDLGLFSYDPSCEFQMALPSVSDTRAQPLDVTDMLGHSGDHALYLLDSGKRSRISDFNLDRGVVMSELPGVDQPVTKLLRHTDRTFVGFNGRNTMVFDPRAKKAIANRSDYRTDNRFSSGETTQTGHLAMGSENGIVRLYKEPGLTRATVNFSINPGDAAILALDISPDENWVLATCHGYLALFNTVAQSTGKLAFDQAMRGGKSQVRRLELSVWDQHTVARANRGVLPPFANGRFEVRCGRIVAVLASVGTALVSWPFAPIENGHEPRYAITFVHEEAIVDEQPLDGGAPGVLFMAPNHLSVADRRVRRS
jgi:hypothetical protein